MASKMNQTFLIWGGNGWIAGILYEMLKKEGRDVHTTTVRMENRESVLAELNRVKPTHVLNCAGVTGRPNVDWCEDNKGATLRANLVGTINLADCCALQGIHCTIYATGCIYAYDQAHPLGSGIGFTETDAPNFTGSYYSFVKGDAEKLLMSAFGDNTLMLRLRMPVSDDLHPRSFVTKITKYAHVVDIPNSNTILTDLLPCSVKLAENSVTGVYNFTNPGAISHNEVLALYKQYVDPQFTWQNFSLEEQSKVIKAGRSNCELDASKLVNKMREYGMEIPEVHQAYAQCFQRMAAGMPASRGVAVAADANTETVSAVSGKAAELGVREQVVPVN